MIGQVFEHWHSRFTVLAVGRLSKGRTELLQVLVLAPADSELVDARGGLSQAGELLEFDLSWVETMLARGEWRRLE